MSLPMSRAAWQLVPGLSDLVRAVAADRRANVRQAKTVMLYLADRYRSERGYVDETHSQIASALGESRVNRSLMTLHDLGIWVLVDGHRGGAGTTGTRRVPGERLSALLDLSPSGRAEVASSSHPDLSPSGRAELASADEPTSARNAPDLSTECPDLSTPGGLLPIDIPVNTPAPRADGDDADADRADAGQRGRSSVVETVIDRAITLHLRTCSLRGSGWRPDDERAYRVKRGREATSMWAATIEQWMIEGRNVERIVIAIAERIDNKPHAAPPAPEPEPTCPSGHGPDEACNHCRCPPSETASKLWRAGYEAERAGRAKREQP